MSEQRATATPGVTVRAVRAGDVPEVVEIVSAALTEFGMSFGVGSDTDDALRELPESYAARGGGFWVAERASDGRLLGTAGIWPLGGGDWEVRKMYLRPETRGMGLGARLLAVALEHARSRGGVRAVLDTVERMDRAIAFYEAHGFVRDDAQVRGARCTRGYALALGPPRQDR